MFDLNSIAEFSRCHCIGICAFLVPTNLLFASATLLLTALDRSPRIIYAIVSIGILPALALFLHVATWWSIGVVMLPTFILPILALTCLAIYAYAVVNRQHLKNLLMTMFELTLVKYRQLKTDRSPTDRDGSDKIWTRSARSNFRPTVSKLSID